MKRVATWIILTMATAALLLAMLPSLPAQTGSGVVVNYNVKFTEGSNLVSVRLDYSQAETDPFNLLPAAGLYGGPQVAFPDNYFENLEARNPQGNPLTVTRNGEAWTISGSTEGTITYSLDLDAFKDLPPASFGVNNPAFSPFLPHYGDTYSFVPGYCLFLTINQPDSFKVAYEVPEGWRAYGGDSSNPSQIISAAIFAGKALTVDVEGEIPLTVVQPQDADSANLAGQQEFADKLAAQLSTANEAWGRPVIPSERLYIYLGGVAPDGIDNQLLFSIPFDPLYGCAFVPVGERENILSTDFLLRAGDEALRVMLGGMNVDASALWFREGCIHYSNLRFAQRSQWISEDDVFNQLGRDYALYLDSLAQSGTSLAGAGDQALQEPMASLLYGGGTIAVTSIDVKLAAKDKSLDEFIAILIDKSPSDELTNQYLQDELKAYSGEDFSAFFKDYVTGDKVIPASSFSQLKLNQGSGEEANAGQNDIKPAPGFGHKWILILIAIGLVFALPFVLEPYTLRPRGGAEAFDHDVEGNKKRRGHWWSWDEEEEADEEDDEEADKDAGGVEEEESPETVEDTGGVEEEKASEPDEDAVEPGTA